MKAIHEGSAEFLPSERNVENADFIQAKLVSHAYPQLREMPFYGFTIRRLRGKKPVNDFREVL